MNRTHSHPRPGRGVYGFTGASIGPEHHRAITGAISAPEPIQGPTVSPGEPIQAQDQGRGDGPAKSDATGPGQLHPPY